MILIPNSWGGDLVESNDCHAPGGSPAGGQFCSTGGGVQSKAFKRWFGKSQVVDDDGDPLRVYHGTTNTFDEFNTEKANPESFWGSGIYFTNETEDVANNYASVAGPDLDNKIVQRAERLAQDYEYDEDSDAKATLDAIFDDPKNGFTAHDKETDSGRYSAALIAAKAELTNHGGLTIPVYLRMVKPAVFGGDNETELTWEEQYDEESDEYGEPKGTLVDFIGAVRNVASRYDDGEVDDFLQSVIEHGTDGGGIKLSDIRKLAEKTENFGYFQDREGRLVNNEILRAALEEIGFDGIIDNHVDQHFGSQKKIGKAMAGMNPDTVHYIVFKPEQVKSAIGNRGTFKKKSKKFTETR